MNFSNKLFKISSITFATTIFLWVITQIGFVVFDFIVERVNTLKVPEHFIRCTTDHISYDRKILIFHGICSSPETTNTIFQHLEAENYAAENVSLLNHDFGMLKLEEIENKILDLVRDEKHFCLIAHSYLAAIITNLSLDNKLPSTTKVVLIAPPIHIKNDFIIGTLAKCFYFQYFTQLDKGLVKMLSKILIDTRCFTRRALVCNQFMRWIESKATIESILNLSQTIRQKIHAGIKMNNDFIMILGARDNKILNKSVQTLLADDPHCAYFKTIQNGSHAPFNSRNVFIREEFFKSLDAGLELLLI